MSGFSQDLMKPRSHTNEHEEFEISNLLFVTFVAIRG